LGDKEWLPDAYFYFESGDYLVWGAYWIGPVDLNVATLAEIDRIKAPVAKPEGF